MGEKKIVKVSMNDAIVRLNYILQWLPKMITDYRLAWDLQHTFLDVRNGTWIVHLIGRHVLLYKAYTIILQGSWFCKGRGTSCVGFVAVLYTIKYQCLQYDIYTKIGRVGPWVELCTLCTRHRRFVHIAAHIFRAL